METLKRGVSVGSVAGSKHVVTGYVVISTLGGAWRAHRLAWLIVHGVDPEENEIDHINRKRDDNRIINLRILSRSGQTLNSASVGKSGHRGVWKRGDKWCASLRVNGVDVFRRQNYDTMEEAVSAREDAARLFS
jgi:hypothetical protein